MAIERNKSIWYRWTVSVIFRFLERFKRIVTTITVFSGISSIKQVIFGVGKLESILYLIKVLSFLINFRFFEQLGTVFSFISNDVHNKITILERMISTGDQSQHYQGLLTMIRYEQGAGILNKSSRNNPSGTRTFIRLHRALQFVHRFVEQLSIATDECCTEPLARSAYQDTLAAHHPWLVQKGAGLALKLLPKRGQLLHNVLGESNWRQMSKSQIDEHFARMSTLAREVFQQCELVITREKVGDLPWSHLRFLFFCRISFRMMTWNDIKK